MMDLPSAAEMHLEAVLMGTAGIVAIIGQNTITHLPQVYRGMADPGTAPGTDFDPPPPFLVVFSQDLGGTPVEQMYTEQPIAAYDSLWTVRGTAREDAYDTLRTLNQLVYEALNDSFGTYPDAGAYVTCALESWLTPTPEVIDGVKHMHRGGIYRVAIQPI